MKNLFVFALFFLSSIVFATTIQGKVVGISDGDTITVLTENKVRYKIRLAEIDTPESRQPYGTKWAC